MIPFDRPVRFEEVDAAGIVFFGHFVSYAHEAMEAFFAGLEGGYANLIMKRKIGFPAVRLEIDYASPARYGDVLRIETRVARIGGRSAVLDYTMKQAEGGAVVCKMRHTIVTTDLTKMASCEMPADVRAILAANVEP